MTDSKLSFSGAKSIRSQRSVDIQCVGDQQTNISNFNWNGEYLYDVKANFLYTEMLRLLRFAFRKNSLMRELVFDVGTLPLALGPRWLMSEHRPDFESLDDLHLNFTGTLTQDKHRALYLIKTYDKEEDLILKMRKSVPSNLLSKHLFDRLRNKNDIVVFTKYLTRQMVVKSVFDYLFNIKFQFRDFEIGIDSAEVSNRLIQHFGRKSQPFFFRYSPNFRFLITQTQLNNEALAVSNFFYRFFNSKGKIHKIKN